MPVIQAGVKTPAMQSEIFDELLIKEDIALLNDDEKPHYWSQNNVHTLIDWSIASIYRLLSRLQL